MDVRAILNCRACGSSSLDEVLGLGSLHVNAFPLPEEPDTPKAPLTLVGCRQCSLLQLAHTVAGDALYRQFWYRSGITLTMKRALLNVVEGVRKVVDLSPGDTVIDIGSNDSTLLNYWEPSLERVGFEPATNLMEEARQGGATVVNDYFSLKGLREVTGKKAKVITAIAMFYDLDTPNLFLEDVRGALAENGVFVIQMAYLPTMLSTNDVGNVCHEHLEYYSLLSLETLLAANGLHVFHVETNEVNGGSFRVYASPTERTPSDLHYHMWMHEKELGLSTQAPLLEFATRVQRIRTQVRDFVLRAERPYVYGASTKGNTLLQYWDLGKEHFLGAAERDHLKLGRVTVGTRIPIVSEEEAREKAGAFLVLPWHFKQEILKREADWLSRGVRRMLFPLPEPTVFPLIDTTSQVW